MRQLDLIPRHLDELPPPGTRIWVSVSGGRTSMKLARHIQLALGKTCELRFVFANTGQEHPLTLAFVDRCDREWGLGIIWVESVTHPGEERSSTHRVVDYKSASTDGKPFERMIEKYGIPNKSFPHCNRELKLNPMRSFIRSIGWDDALVAVGIRADEPKRIRKAAKAEGIVYPFAHWWPMDKQDVITWWEDQPFDLDILEREGNCVWCWKKSDRKHYANIAANPAWYDFPRRMEAIHSTTNRANPQVFFRGAVSTDGLFRNAGMLAADPRALASEEETGSCSESCEAYSAE